MKLPRAAAVVTSLLLGALAARAHPPISASVLDPRTPPEAWNVLRLATANVDQLLRENRLAEIADQVSLCSPALRALARLAPPGQSAAVAERTVHAAAEVSSVAQAAMVGDRATTAGAVQTLRADLQTLAGAFDPAAVHADVYFCPMHPDFLRTDPAARCERCGMTLQLRRIPYSFIYTPPGEPTLRLAVSPDAPLAPGREARVTVRLSQRDGTPVLASDLEVTHTQPIHLLIVDPGLEDYHHEHPIPAATPGEYTFSFVPAKDTPYRIFADVMPFATGVQEYPFANLPGTNNAPHVPPHGDSTMTCEAGGLRFVLTIDPPDDSPPRAREVRDLQVQVLEADGQPTRRLEPVMNAFAHLVGFYDDGHTVLHLHPQGGEIVDPAQRGGPTLDFRFYPSKAGFLRLFCQVQVSGKAVYAPFSVNVAP